MRTAGPYRKVILRGIRDLFRSHMQVSNLIFKKRTASAVLFLVFRDEESSFLVSGGIDGGAEEGKFVFAGKCFYVDDAV